LCNNILVVKFPYPCADAQIQIVAAEVTQKQTAETIANKEFVIGKLDIEIFCGIEGNTSAGIKVVVPVSIVVFIKSCPGTASYLATKSLT
jgi:hypothetical protein